MKTKSVFVLSKWLPINDFPIVISMQTLDAIDKEYSKLFPLWLMIVITICSTLVGSPLIFLCIW